MKADNPTILQLYKSHKRLEIFIRIDTMIFMSIDVQKKVVNCSVYKNETVLYHVMFTEIYPCYKIIQQRTFI